MAVEMTEAAVRRAAVLVQEQADAKWLRVGIRGGGCSGLSYFLDFVGGPEDKDKIFEFADSVRLCVDRKSYLFLNGVQIDFQEDLLKTGFVFKNPNAASTCSCGDSFSI